MATKTEVLQDIAPHLEHLPDSQKLFYWANKSPWEKFDNGKTRIAVQMIQTVDENYTSDKADWVENILRFTFYEHKFPCIFEIPAGSNFYLGVELNEGDDFTDYLLVARHAVSGAALSTMRQGASYSHQKIQYVLFEQWGQTIGDFIRVNFNIEVADGDAIDLLEYCYIYTLPDIDTA